MSEKHDSSNFWKTKTFSEKLEYFFLVETTKVEKTSFPFKTALSEANVKTNINFASNYFVFLENLFQF